MLDGDERENMGRDGHQETKMLTVLNLYVITHHVVSILTLYEDVVKTSNVKNEERRGTGYDCWKKWTMPMLSFQCPEISSYHRSQRSHLW